MAGGVASASTYISASLESGTISSGRRLPTGALLSALPPRSSPHTPLSFPDIKRLRFVRTMAVIAANVRA